MTAQPIVGDMFLNAAAWKVKYALKDEVRLPNGSVICKRQTELERFQPSQSASQHDMLPAIGNRKSLKPVMEHIDNDNIDDIIDKCLEVDPVGGMCRDYSLGP